VTDIVLVGGGHAHVHVIRDFALRPTAGVRLTLVSATPSLTYSGRVPGVVEGRIPSDGALVDLSALCRRAGATLIRDEAVGLDPRRRRLETRESGGTPYDLLSLDVGSVPDLAGIAGAERAVPVKPIGGFLERFERFRSAALRPGGPRDVVVAGGGAAGVEIILAVAARLRRDARASGLDPAAFRFALIAGDGLVPGAPRRLRDRLRRALAAAGVLLFEGRRLAAVSDREATLSDGGRAPADAVLLAPSAAPHPLGRRLGLPLDERGFILVEPTLASPGDPRVFAAGDCASVAGFVRPKAGVFAVRQGPALADNLRRAARGLAPRPHQPRKKHLQIIGLADGTAVAGWGEAVVSGRLVLRLKDMIDRRWVEAYRSSDAPRHAAVERSA
jgi:selenide,water dikinase